MKNENVPGRFYVDQEECINCGVCEYLAPEIFGAAESSDTFVVKRQPFDPEECREAMELCPTNCIYDDGEDKIGQRIPRHPLPPTFSGDVQLPPNEQKLEK